MHGACVPGHKQAETELQTGVVGQRAVGGPVQAHSWLSVVQAFMTGVHDCAEHHQWMAQYNHGLLPSTFAAGEQESFGNAYTLLLDLLLAACVSVVLYPMPSCHIL